jgi:hypothetical protein
LPPGPRPLGLLAGKLAISTFIAVIFDLFTIFTSSRLVAEAIKPSPFQLAIYPFFIFTLSLFFIFTIAIFSFH